MWGWTVPGGVRRVFAGKMPSDCQASWPRVVIRGRLLAEGYKEDEVKTVDSREQHRMAGCGSAQEQHSGSGRQQPNWLEGMGDAMYRGPLEEDD